jgi:branched-chain amino acid transport system permease protein
MVTAISPDAVVILQSSLTDRLMVPFEKFFSDLVALDPVILQLLVFGILLGGVYGLASLGLTIIFGVMDVINFAHGVFMAIGMYVIWVVTNSTGINPILLVPLAALVVFVIGIASHVAVIRPVIDGPAESHLLVTFGMVLILESGLQILFQPDPRTLSLGMGNFTVGSVQIPIVQVIALVIAVLAVILVWLLLFRTRLGRAIRATSDNRDDAEFVGINVPRINYLTFGLGAGLAGLAGGAISLFRLFDPFIGTTQYLAYAFVIVVLGGLGSLQGALVGGLIIGLVQIFAGFYTHGTTHYVFIMLIFIGVLLFKPEGLFGSELE